MWVFIPYPTIQADPCRPPKQTKGGPRKSNTGTPVPGDDASSNIIVERLSYADSPRSFKSTTFTSKLSSRTATTSSTGVRKNAKQILGLERERLSGGDGFMSAQHVEMRKKGVKIELGNKKKVGVKKGSLQNLMKGKRKREALTPAESEAATESATPGLEDDEGEAMDVDRSSPVKGSESSKTEALANESDGTPKKEIITYHTPTAPPSLLPAKKYCDITGLHANYTDPRTKLRYRGLDVWHAVRGLGPGGDQAYLSLRNAQTSLK
ncbi:hypothetical protein I350_02001 [Cryptococcus amylolentus CBS 6273]|uniref:Vps72/YL1 C-terminal domain-containing protein n=1 Tax=Cryptococcus amylolentus CBS 6273 TaxID=1296118 RepID=A0A1E3K9B5_9TREE|nr:hypothetical protein I350_02001 [Cryptococcus amylolentus CBS 6273]